MGPIQALKLYLEKQLVRLSLEKLSQEPNLDSWLNLLTLPMRPEAELSANSRQILDRLFRVVYNLYRIVHATTSLHFMATT